MSFIRVCSVQDVPVGKGKKVFVGKKVLALYLHEGTYYAVKDVCPHQGISLSYGWLEGRDVVCPGHGWKFDLATGQCSTVPGQRVARCEVRVEGDDLLVSEDYLE